MIVKIWKSQKVANHIVIAQSNLINSKDKQVVSFFSNKMKISKSNSFLVDLFVKVDGKKIKNIIIVKYQKESDFESNIEEIVAKVWNLIKNVNWKFSLDFDSTKLSNSSKRLFEDLVVYNLYDFTAFKTTNKNKYSLLIKDIFRDSFEYNSFVENLLKTRDMICKSAEHVNPDSFEKYILELFKGNNIKIQLFDAKSLQSMGMGWIYWVWKGSTIPPRLIIVEYKPNIKDNFKYGLVWKWVTYDSWWYNIKPTGNIEDMYVDMWWAAVVVWVLKYLVDNNYWENVVSAVPLAENLISWSSQKPWDVIKTYNWKTVEIWNTDAEWRLLLADSLAYIDKIYNPKMIIDIATLTWSQIIALGRSFAWIIGANPKLNKSLQTLSLIIKERAWELPMFQPYFKSMSSDYADMKNISSWKFAPWCITAWLFLSQFVKNKNWIHLDVAWPMWWASLWSDPLYWPYPTAFWYRLLINFLNNSK